MSLSRSEQARINGAKSRGPKTPEGKRISSENAFKHGMAANKIFVLANESAQTFAACVQTFTETFKPCNDVEMNFIMQAAAAQWRLRRIYMLETAAFDMQMDKQAEELEKNFQSFDEATRTLFAFEALANETRTLDLLQRYESRLSREYERAIRNFDRARAERTQAEQEVVAQSAAEQPETNEPAPQVPAATLKRPNEPKPLPYIVAQPNTPPAQISPNEPEKRLPDRPAA